MQVMRILSSALLLKEDIRELFVNSQTDMPDKTDGQLSLDFEFD